MNTWMEKLHSSLKDAPLIHLAIPGAHDCMTYTITSSSEVAPDNEPVVESLAKLFGGFGRRYMKKWCITQDLDIWQQLVNGIRYLDFRLAKNSDSQIYFCHGLYGDDIEFYLPVVNRFLEDNKGEVVIMDFQHFYNFSIEEHITLINDHIKKTFGDKLCPYTTPETDVTLSWMLKNKYRAIVIYRDKAIEELNIDGLWPGPAWVSPWPNTTSLSELEDFVKNSLSTRDINKGFVTQCILTPDASFLALNIFGNLRKKCAKPVFKKLKPWLKQQFSGPHGVNVVIADFVSNGGFPRLIVDLNNN